MWWKEGVQSRRNHFLDRLEADGLQEQLNQVQTDNTGGRFSGLATTGKPSLVPGDFSSQGSQCPHCDCCHLSHLPYGSPLASENSLANSSFPFSKLSQT